MEMEYHMFEPPNWDPVEAFVEVLKKVVIQIIPAFLAGTLMGTILWTSYALVLQRCTKNRNPINESRTPSPGSRVRI